MTTTLRQYPTRVAVRFDKKNGMIAIDQIRTIDKARILSSLGQLSTKQIEACKAVLKETFVDWSLRFLTLRPIFAAMNTINELISGLLPYTEGAMLTLLLGGGLFLALYSGFTPYRYFKHAIERQFSHRRRRNGL